MKTINILLVEDDRLDALDINRSLSKLNLSYTLQIAKNGEEALSILDGPETNNNKLPDVILLDINMPRMNGLELLEIIRKRDDLKKLKCFILTTSDETYDRETAQKLGISGYIIKPLKLTSPETMDALNLMIDLMNI